MKKPLPDEVELPSTQWRSMASMYLHNSMYHYILLLIYVLIHFNLALLFKDTVFLSFMFIEETMQSPEEPCRALDSNFLICILYISL